MTTDDRLKPPPGHYAEVTVKYKAPLPNMDIQVLADGSMVQKNGEPVPAEIQKLVYQAPRVQNALAHEAIKKAQERVDAERNPDVRKAARQPSAVVKKALDLIERDKKTTTDPAARAWLNAEASRLRLRDAIADGRMD